jgi:MFS family permease
LVSTLYAIGTLTGSLALPLVGRQIDRRGPRLMVVVISLLFGLACIYMGLVQGAVTLALGFVAIRMLGQGSLGLVSQNIINQWWQQRRGTMMGLSGVASSLLGLSAFPALITGRGDAGDQYRRLVPNSYLLPTAGRTFSRGDYQRRGRKRPDRRGARVGYLGPRPG